MPSALRPVDPGLFSSSGVGVNDVGYQPMSDYVGAGEFTEVDVVDAVEDVHGRAQT